MNTQDIELPPLHYDELPEPDDPLPAMFAYGRKCIESYRNRVGELVKVPSDDADAKHVQDFINCDGMGAVVVEGPQYSAVVRALLAAYGTQPTEQEGE